MCDCTSCSYTDAFSGRADLFRDGSPTIKGFDNWPRGKPKGFSASSAEYKAHAKHCGSIGLPKPWRFVPGKPPQFSTHGLVMPIQPAPKWLHDWINRKEPDQAEARPASPAAPAKAPQHFPERDRAPEAKRDNTAARASATIYAMPKSKRETPKRQRGRPAIEGRRVVIKLRDEQIKRAERLGNGSISEGIRKALGARD